jgi:D-galactarolactone cycloisomerase
MGGASKIVRIDGYEVASPLPERVGNSRGFFENRVSLLIRITTAGGISGWGETWAFPAAAAALIRADLGPSLLGKTARNPRPLHEAMLAKLNIDRRGIFHHAISALDIAIWDASARCAGIPLHEALGGALREKVFAYVSGPFMKPGADPYRDFPRDIGGYLELGFRAIKVRIGTTPGNDAVLIRHLRDLVGPDIHLMADLNQGFSVSATLELAPRLAEAKLRWLEEPIIYDDLPGYRRLSERLPLALAGGESLFGLAAFRDFVAARVFDLVQPDLAVCGGISEALKIAALAEAFDIPVVPHVWGTLVNFNASLHFAAILPEERGQGMPFPLFEYDYSYNPFRTLCGESKSDGDGYIALPEGPGLGFELEPEMLAPFVVNHWTLQ